MDDLNKYGYREEFSPFGDPDAQDPDPAVRRRFFGKYRGTVVINIDPMGQGRLMVSVPDVLGLFLSSWALPCVPFTGIASGFYVVPLIGSRVWVEFEQGDPDFPVWVGGFWDVPREISPVAEASTVAAPAGPVIDIETLTCGISICDLPLPPFGGQVNIHAGETMITLTEAAVMIVAPAVTITAPVITLNGATTINGVTTINGATTVTGDTIVSGATTLDGDVAVAGNITVVGDVDITGAVPVTGAVDIIGPLGIEGDVAIVGALELNGVAVP
jgi:hypothetical protein